MTVIRAGVHSELCKHRPAQRVLGQHAFHCAFDHSGWVFLKLLTQSDLFNAARITGVAVIALGFCLIASDPNLFRIYDHDMIARVDVGGVLGLVLPTKP